MGDVEIGSDSTGERATLARLKAFAICLAVVACAQQPPPREPAGHRSSTVTLITGDRVHVSTMPDGKQTAVVVAAERGSGDPGPGFATYDLMGHLYVIPDDVAADVGGLLDPTLFDVSELIEEGYDDAAAPALPLIVSYAESLDDTDRIDRAQRIAGVLGHESAKPLASIRAAAIRQSKTRAAEFGKIIGRHASLAVNRPGWREATELAGIEKIWLDRKAKATLQDSVPQIGAPAAWQLGIDGSGSTVAVVDTGVDSTHPDLAGRIAEARNFTPDPAGDHFGHGTHVASIIAGSGAASHGLRKGVAPGATLYAAKVLGDDGSGQFSWIIAGMEWAAARAQIVNMSLGGGPTDGTDPLSQALNQLTSQFGTLFVVAAGNRGTDKTIGSPGSADSALTVGAVDKHDGLASFSSRGPRFGDFALKPEITAPGVTIIAARAAGTSLGGVFDAHYTALSGTSMATPHVAGAAALLVQAHPDWKAGQLKAALVSTAAVNPANTVYEQGGGRVDVARAISQKLLVTPATLNLGYLRWPHDGAPLIRRTLTYTNASSGKIDLALSLDVRDRRGQGSPAAAGMITLTQPALSIGPKSSASVEVILDRSLGASDLYGGYLVASQRGDDDQPGAVVRTPIGFTREEQTHTLTVKLISRNGRPPRGSLVVMNTGDSSIFLGARFFLSGSASFVVPGGTYSVMADLFTTDTNVMASEDVLTGKPEVLVAQDTTVVLDARDSQEILIDTPGRPTKRNYQAAEVLGYERLPIKGNGIAFRRFTHLIDNRMFAQPMPPVTQGVFEAFSGWRLEAPDILMRVASPTALTLHPEYINIDDTRLDGDAELPVVSVGQGLAADLAGIDLKGKIALIQRLSTQSRDATDQVLRAAAAGAAFAIVYNDRPGSDALYVIYGQTPIPAFRLSQAEGQTLLGLLAGGPVTLHLRGIANSPYLYNLVFVERGGISNNLHYVADETNLATLNNTFYTHKPNRSLQEFRAFLRPQERRATVVGRRLGGMPGHRTEYVSSGDTLWGQGVIAQNLFALFLAEPLTHYAAGETRAQSWFKQPLRPGVMEGFVQPGQLNGRPGFRFGDTFYLDLPSYVDAQGHWGFNNGRDSMAFRLFRDGQLIATSNQGAFGLFELGPGAADYRLELDVDKGADLPGLLDWQTLSTSTHTVWTFPSRQNGSSIQNLPLLLVDYDLDLDLLNRARGKGTSIALRARHQPGTAAVPIERVRLRASFDDGKTWREIPVQKGQDEAGDGTGRFQAFLGNVPRDAGFVSLKTEASDEEGSRIEQVILRAFALAPDSGLDACEPPCAGAIGRK